MVHYFNQIEEKKSKVLPIDSKILGRDDATGKFREGVSENRAYVYP